MDLDSYYESIKSQQDPHQPGIEMEQQEAFNERMYEPQSMDDIHLREFILLMETLPEVWDSSSSDCMNKVKRAKAYEQLLEIYKNIKPAAAIKDVIAKVNSLKSNYRKDLKRIADSKRSGSSTDQIYKPRSWVFHLLQFMNKTEKPINMNTFSSPEETMCRQEEQEPVQASFSSLNEVEPPPKKQVKKLGPIARQNDLLEKACNYLSQSQQSPPALPSPMALYWTEKLKRLSTNQRLLAEKAINDILFEAELGTLNRNSVQINTFGSPLPIPSTAPYTISPPTPSPTSSSSVQSEHSVPSPAPETNAPPHYYTKNEKSVPTGTPSKLFLTKKTNSAPFVIISSDRKAPSPFTFRKQKENTSTTGIPSQLIIKKRNVYRNSGKNYSLHVPSASTCSSITADDEYTSGPLSSYKSKNN